MLYLKTFVGDFLNWYLEMEFRQLLSQFREIVLHQQNVSLMWARASKY